MPIEPLIPMAASARPVPVALHMPLESAQQVQQLRNMQQQGSIMQRQQTNLDLENQQRQLQIEQQRRDLADQAIVQKAYRDIALGNGDYSKLPGIVQGKVQPKTFFALQKGVVEHQEAMAKLTDQQLGNVKTHAGLIGSYAQRLKSLPAEQRGDAWARLRPEIVSSGLAPANELPEMYPGDAWVDDHVAASLDAAKQVELEEKRRAEQRAVTAATDTHNKSVAELPKIQAEGEQAVRANWATKLRNAQSPEQYASMLREAPAWVADEVRAVVPVDKFDPQTSPGAIQGWALTPQQATQAAARQTAQDSTDKYRNRSLEIRQQIADRADKRIGGAQNQQFLLREADKHDTLQRQEQEQWDLHRSLGEIIANIQDGETFYDPLTRTSIPITMDEAARTRLKAQAQKAETAAQQLQRQQTEMRRRYQWGEFASKPGEPEINIDPNAKVTPKSGTAPAQKTQPQKQALPQEIVSKLSADRVTKLSDGTAWALVNGQPTQMKKENGRWVSF